MENKRKWNRIVYICMIFILSSGLIFYPAAHTQVYAEDVEDGDGGETEESPSSNDSEEKDEKENYEDKSEDKDNDDKEKDESEQLDESDEQDESDEEDKTSENEEEESEEVDGDYSFTIHSEKVEGEMDVLGALGGEIDIEQGTIQGLTITQNVETDDGSEVVIQIKSPGPVEVENLQTKNIGGAPSFGGICGLDPVCMEDVTMEVDHQNVEKISLPDASIETCFADECDDMHEVSTDKDALEDTKAMMKEQLSSLEDIMDSVENDEEIIEETKELLEESEEIYEEVKEEQIEALDNNIEQIEEELEEKFLNDEENKEENSD